MATVELTEANDLYIGGCYVPARGDVVEVVEPATETVFARLATASNADVDLAVAAANKGLREWSALEATNRAELMIRFAEELAKRSKATAALVSRQNGMPITLSKPVNGYLPAMLLRYYADMIIDSTFEEVRPGLDGARTRVIQRPVGVVAAITPWNYPQALAAIKLAPALAAGCSVVLKPSPETSLDAYAFGDAAAEAGLPDGVVNVVAGGREAGQYLVSHPGVDKVAFTGSSVAGENIGEVCGRLMRPVTLELGGKSAAIITEEADLSDYLGKILRVSMPNGGQTCHSSTRILAPRSRYGEVVDAVSDTVSSYAIGDPLDKQTQIGPMVSQAHRDRVLSFIDLGRHAGARVTTGGGIPAAMDRGWFVAPTVFADVDNSMTIAREEIFGPVLSVIGYRDIDEAIAIANDSDYGLAGTIWTSDEEHGVEIARRIETGTVGVNHYSLDPAAPFGGIKRSGIGREMGPEGLRSYQVSKSIYLAPPKHRANWATKNSGVAK
ncbi:aldehyde dehydrogenase [Rhodococcus koreensis]